MLSSGGDDMVNKVLKEKRKKRGVKNTNLMPRNILFSTRYVGVLSSNITYQNCFSCYEKAV